MKGAGLVVEKNILNRIGFDKVDVEKFKKSDLKSQMATGSEYNEFLTKLSKLRNSDASTRGNMDVSTIDKFSAYVHSKRTTAEFEKQMENFMKIILKYYPKL